MENTYCNHNAFMENQGGNEHPKYVIYKRTAKKS